MAATGVVLFWGFTVDDAFITARVAHSIATGHGYRFNADGPVVDAVTPLGWAYCLALFGRTGPLAAWQAARWLGASAWIASSAWLGASVARSGTTIWPLAMLAIISPLGFWASSGMETAAITALVTFGTGYRQWSLVSVAVAAAWRPELLPFAFVLAVGRASSVRVVLANAATSMLPAVLVALVRWSIFRVPYPMAVIAKPSDTQHGFWYALEALVWTGPVWLWLASGWPWIRHFVFVQSGTGNAFEFSATKPASWTQFVPGIPRLPRDELVLSVAVITHFLAVMLAGGDWMPAYRLIVPVLPAMLRIACHIPGPRSRALTVIGATMALTTTLILGTRLGPSARRIANQRQQLVANTSPYFSGARAIASPDVGWVGVAFSGRVVDLAGATDDAIANLPGGHTSKKISSRVFVSKHVDRILVLLAPNARQAEPWTESEFARTIDYRAAWIGFELGCSPERSIELPFAHQSYLLLHCSNP